MSSRSQQQKGAALVLVIGIVTLLLVVAASFLYDTWTNVRAMRNAVILARAEAIARAAVARALLEASKPRTSPGVWRASPVAQAWTFDGAAIRIVLTDESGKIDVNFTNPVLLNSLLRSLGLGEDAASRVADAIQDWRDPDSLRRPNGAEEGEYRQAGLPGRPANQPFQAVEELQLVLGMEAELYRRIAPMVTVFSRAPGVNPAVASRSVLLGLPNVTEEQVDGYLAERETALASGRPAPIFAPAAAFTSFAQTSALTVRAEVDMGGGLRVGREAVAVLTPQFARRPVALLSWREVALDKVSVGEGLLAR